ncbi:MAG: FG-GAP-like repeat-containing protein [Cyanobacteriota bacterium]|nr:FG-GAP-like repeat-containing protein [Cyanobacteriota bacterium]
MTTQELTIPKSTLLNPQLWQWERIPKLSDPRLAVLGILATYLILGITVLGFNRSPAQILLIISSASALDMLYHWLFRRRTLLLPLSGAITGCSLSILTNFAHGSWLLIIPVFFAISSKYLITFKNRHVFNPALFGIAMSLLFANDAISASPAYQWGGSLAMVMFVVTAALLLFVLKIKRNALIISFLGFYAIQLGLRAYLMQDIVPPQTLIMGAITAPAFYLFTFFMITDPATSPPSVKGQVWMSFIIVVIDLLLHKYETLSTFFYAGFIYFAGRFVWIFVAETWQTLVKDKGRNYPEVISGLFQGIYRWGVIGLIAVSGIFVYQNFISAKDTVKPDFKFVEITAESAGMSAKPSDILERVDPRVKNVGKWLLSVGDAVAVADANNDGLLDVFLTYPLKDKSDRASLYLNQGNFQFSRFPLPALGTLTANPTTEGLPSGALWFDSDNDGDEDLLVTIGYGKTRLLQNLLREKGELDFVDIGKDLGIDEYTISLTANAFDMNRDGKLDLLIGNAMSPYLNDYEKPTEFNIFNLPAAEYEGDRRMFDFMHRSWYDANNGGQNLFYLNTGNSKVGNSFEKQDITALGISEHRWTLDIGTGDFNGDSWTDLYLASDFGPDELFINQKGEKFELIKGALVGDLSRDTYKGMNASLGDIDNNGTLDIYVSNVHHKLQAEGSLLWINKGNVDKVGAKAFEDEAMKLNVLNEDRFGWGGAMGDLDRDGKLDIVQANGMVDDSYDRHLRSENMFKPNAILPAPQFSELTSENTCPDYWYWNAQIALTNPDVHGYADRWADLQGRCIFPYEQNRVYLNGEKRFIDVANQVGWTEKTNSRGIALADLDNDGDLDALVTHQFAPVSIYRNDSAPKSWLGLELVGNGKTCNVDALGSRVIVESKSGKQLREVSASNGFSAQGDKRLLFGFGNDSGEVEVTINWCGDGEAEVMSLMPNRYYRVVQ